jgi:thymidylate kinase
VNAPELVDSAVAGRVLVYGSLPPDGRDLDLLVREREERLIIARLADAGFASKSGEWARFTGCSAEIVELTGAASWHLPSDELDLLFAEGQEIEGLHNLVRPSAHHALLILARRLTGGAGVLDQKLRARVERALLEDPEAWARARERADRWRAASSLKALHDAWRTGARVPRMRRAAARRERVRAGAGPHHAARRLLGAVARQLPRPHRGAVIAFSGLDGAGKSSQAAALRDTLDRLGYDAIVVRTRITWDDWLWTVARPIKRLVGLPLRAWSRARSALGASEPLPAHERDDDAPAHDPVTRMREASSILTDLWTLTIVVANASSQWRLMHRQLLRGGIVICDRYTLDSIVALRYSYGSERPLRAARMALSRLYPRPVRAYLIDVLPETALARKGEWGIAWLTRHRELYLEECERLGVRVLDGEQPDAETSAQVAGELWLNGI